MNGRISRLMIDCFVLDWSFIIGLWESPAFRISILCLIELDCSAGSPGEWEVDRPKPDGDNKSIKEFD